MEFGVLGGLGTNARDPAEIQLAVVIVSATTPYHYMVGMIVRPLTQVALKYKDAIKVCVQVAIFDQSIHNINVMVNDKV